MNKLKIVLFVSLIVLSLSVTAKEVVNCAFKQIGAKFPSPPWRNFDSQQLAYYCHNKSIPNTSKAQASRNKIKIIDKKPGDLLFFHCSIKGKGTFLHTVIYVGNDEFIEIPLFSIKARKQKINPEYCGGKIISASRYWK